VSDRRTDEGFTLVEVLIVMVLIGIVATVIAAAATVILRTQGPTNTRVQDSRTLHGLTSWLAQDASATPPGQFDLSPAAPTGCVGVNPGTSLVRMNWSEDTGTAVNYVANYRFVDQGGGDFRIERHTCSGTGPGPYANPTVIRLGSRLSSTTPIVTPVGAPTRGVSFELFTPDGESIFVDGDSRNPSETLPSTTTSTTTTTPPSTTTTTPTTTVPPAPCSLVGSPGVSASPNPISNAVGGGPQPLVGDVTVTIQVTGSCTSLTLRYNRGSGGNQVEPFTGTYPNFTVVLEADSGQKWTDGAHPLNVFNGAVGPLNTSTYNLVVN
jgi:prepilin-type N-terminal cleavage/methylation domain-containing protein